MASAMYSELPGEQFDLVFVLSMDGRSGRNHGKYDSDDTLERASEFLDVSCEIRLGSTVGCSKCFWVKP